MINPPLPMVLPMVIRKPNELLIEARGCVPSQSHHYTRYLSYPWMIQNIPNKK